MTNVELNAISSPPDTHAPLTAQITGLLMARSARPGLFENSGSDGFAGASPACATSLKSTPAVNTGSTAVITTTRTPASCSALESSVHNPSRIDLVSAFFTSGRSIVIVRIPSSSATRRCSLTSHHH